MIHRRETTDPQQSESLDRDLWRLQRNAFLSAWRAWNTSLDEVFYEGSILIVHPGTARRPIDLLMPWEFVSQQQAEDEETIDAIVLAGVGSSALGTAALARNVADHLQRPVAGIVSGFGMSDVLTEALGGWFVLGARNMLREMLARILDTFQLKDHVRDTQSHSEMKSDFELAGIDRDHFIYGIPDSAVLLYLLIKLPSISLLVGHSKGNLSLENALEVLLQSCRQMGKPVPADLEIVTLGAVTYFPAEFSNVHQFLGRRDYFGLMNSRVCVEREWVSHARHSLNSERPDPLSVRDALIFARIS